MAAAMAQMQDRDPPAPDRQSRPSGPLRSTGKLSSAARAAFRTEQLAQIPDWYSPWAHLIFPSVVGLCVIALCLSAMRDLRAWQLLTVPVVFLFSNAMEWRLHRDVLHRRQPIGGMLYDRHTPIHHRLFVEEDMAIRSTKEFRLILIPAYGILAIFFVTLPLSLGIAHFFDQRNVGLLFLATCMAYTVSYEWLHLAYHLPEQSWVGRLSLVQALRRHHATHHRPELMQRWNFNVTIPLWDWVRGTSYRSPPHTH